MTSFRLSWDYAHHKTREQDVPGRSCWASMEDRASYDACVRLMDSFNESYGDTYRIEIARVAPDFTVFTPEQQHQARRALGLSPIGGRQ
jgi:hypothetical protein